MSSVDREQAAQRRQRADGAELARRARAARRRRVLHRADCAATLRRRAGGRQPSPRRAPTARISSASCASASGSTRARRSSAMHGETLGGATIYGATAAELYDLARDADLLINISGHLSRARAEGIASAARRTSTSIRATRSSGTRGRHGAARLEGHDCLLHGRPAHRHAATARIPTGGIGWQPHLASPIVLDGRLHACSRRRGRGGSRRSRAGAAPYGPVSTGRRPIGSKAHEFRKLIELPRVSRPAVRGRARHPSGRRDGTWTRCARHGLATSSTRDVSATIRDVTARYIDRSAAECSAAQGMYVQTNSGWFSDRTARYLAAGKPALVQDTGFDDARRAKG